MGLLGLSGRPIALKNFVRDLTILVIRIGCCEESLVGGVTSLLFQWQERGCGSETERQTEFDMEKGDLIALLRSAALHAFLGLCGPLEVVDPGALQRMHTCY